MKITKNNFLAGFSTIVVILALGRCVSTKLSSSDVAKIDADSTVVDSIDEAAPKIVAENIKKPIRYNRILSVPSFKETFPDSQSVQEVAAHKWGVKPVANRQDAEKRKKELVYIESNPYYHVDKMSRSIPYLVPRAAILLNDIARSFLDSLYMKGVP